MDKKMKNEELQSRREFFKKAAKGECFRKVLRVTVVAVTVLLWWQLCTSCSTSKSVDFYCADKFVDLYINGEYAGRELVHYTFPSSEKRVTVSCYYEGLEIYSRTYYVKSSDGQMIELQIPKNYFYSTEKH